MTDAKSVESYKHLYAKQVLAGWLQELQKEALANNDSYTDLPVKFLGSALPSYKKAISWRYCRNVYTEYPIAEPVGTKTGIALWDEMYDEPELKGLRYVGCPTYTQLIEVDIKPTCILDVAVAHKGNIMYGFEVVHRHKVTPQKEAILKSLDMTVYEIQAEWIMKQVSIPNYLQVTNWW